MTSIGMTKISETPSPVLNTDLQQLILATRTVAASEVNFGIGRIWQYLGCFSGTTCDNLITRSLAMQEHRFWSAVAK